MLLDQISIYGNGKTNKTTPVNGTKNMYFNAYKVTYNGIHK